MVVMITLASSIMAFLAPLMFAVFEPTLSLLRQGLSGRLTCKVIPSLPLYLSLCLSRCVHVIAKGLYRPSPEERRHAQGLAEAR